MKVVVFGLGSMGRRRIRCLHHLGVNDITGYDIQPGRVEQAQEKNVQVVSDWRELQLEEMDALFICTPPDKHEFYLKLAVEYEIPCFVEASVLLDNLEMINQESLARNVLIAPSATMLFHQAIRKIMSLVQSKVHGKVSNFSYHCGQYLPDWHPWESVKDYYVSNPETGGCREIVPFELTWIVQCFGIPKQSKGLFGHTVDVGADISDTYAISLEFEDSFGTVLVDVTSRFGLRHLILNFEQAQIQWRWDWDYIEIYTASNKKWEKLPLEISAGSYDGYNANIHESMYIEEVASFLDAVRTPEMTFPNTLAQDIDILKLLVKLEQGE